MALEVTRTTASESASMVASATSRTPTVRTSSYTTAFMLSSPLHRQADLLADELGIASCSVGALTRSGNWRPRLCSPVAEPVCKTTSGGNRLAVSDPELVKADGQLAHQVQREIERSREMAARLAETEAKIADVQDEVARTYEQLAARRGDSAYRERAARAREAAQQARSMAEHDRSVAESG